MSDELNALDIAGENAPVVTTEPVVETAIETAPDGTPSAEIDQTPDAAAMEADIEKLKDRKIKAEREAGYWQRKERENRMAAHDTVAPARPAPAEILPAAEPKQADFDDYNDFVNATVDFRVAKARGEWDAEAANKVNQAGAAERDAALHTKLEEGYAKYDDFAEVAFDHTAVHITPMIKDILCDCENPADVAYHLAKNRVEGVAISRMTPTMAAREIAKIDIEFGEGKGPNPTVKKTTSAPAPIKPIGSGPSGGNKDPAKMTQAEYNEWRKSQGAKPY